ncbi:MAG: precorrin-4 C(11)-methyltransferase [Culturomica sp.]|jgi:precorrin-4 C11-methyltransferase|nr:precorrin-4 C(11)-methyltransferase [Culturomica sp.]
MIKQAIILTSEAAYPIAQTIARELPGSQLFAHSGVEGAVRIASIQECVRELFDRCESLIFIGAMGICVRSIAPHIRDKHTDPAVVNIDSTGQYAVSVLAGHTGGANDLTKRVALILGAEAVITTQSDNTHLWALDTIGNRYGWATTSNRSDLNRPLALFVNRRPTALLLDIDDEGTRYLERTVPAHVKIYHRYEDIDPTDYELLIAVTPYLYPHTEIPVLYYHPKVLHLGVGCRKMCNPEGVSDYIANVLKENNLSVHSIKDLSSIELKKEEPLLQALQISFGHIPVNIYATGELQEIKAVNPSEKVKEVTTLSGVAEPAAIRSAGGGALLLEKQKGKLSEGNDFTFAVAIDRNALRRGHIEIVGAGPGDPDLVSVKGRYFLEAADLILYAGSLVPAELTHCAKQGAVVRSSASMNLEEQFALMKEFYDRGKLVVRLHTGDPCIYGAIQEQMAFFDAHDLSYHITPGISSFQAAAAALRSQFTIPEEVQTIILTRGEGRTPVPEKEKLSLLARSQSTLCIFLSASVIDSVQQELLEHYPPETPVAACYKLTWKDEKIYRGELRELAKIVKENHLTLTTLIVVGKAIDNRRGLSRLYAQEFTHLFRK